MVIFLIQRAFQQHLTHPNPNSNEKVMSSTNWRRKQVVEKILLQPGTKISEFSADFSSKYRFSVSLEKKNAWKIRLPEKSSKNRQYRRFFDEKSEISDISVEKSGVSSTRWEAR